MPPAIVSAEIEITLFGRIKIFMFSSRLLRAYKNGPNIKEQMVREFMMENGLVKSQMIQKEKHESKNEIKPETSSSATKSLDSMFLLFQAKSPSIDSIIGYVYNKTILFHIRTRFINLHEFNRYGARQVMLRTFLNLDKKQGYQIKVMTGKGKHSKYGKQALPETVKCASEKFQLKPVVSATNKGIYLINKQPD